MPELLVGYACYAGGKSPVTGPSRVLGVTAKRYGIDLQPWGRGEQWTGFTGAKVFGFRKWLDTHDAPYVMMADTTDVMFMRGPEAIVKTYKEMDVGLLYACSPGEWPIGYRRDELAKKAQKLYGVVQFPDTGVVIGRRDDWIKALDVLIATVPAAVKSGAFPKNLWEEDVAWWSHCWLAGLVDMTLDVERRLAVETHRRGFCVGAYRIEETESGKELVDVRNGNRPHVIHFPGLVAQKFHMPILYAKVFGEKL